MKISRILKRAIMILSYADVHELQELKIKRQEE
jgi:hypothetical protein